MIATKLQSEGYEVDKLLLFDSYPFTGNLDELPQTLDSSWREIALGTHLVVPPEKLRTRLDAESVLMLAREQSHILGTFSLQQLSRLAAILANNSRLVPTARLGMFHGDIILFSASRTTAGLDRSRLSSADWLPFCDGTVCNIEVDAEHHQMLTPEALRQLGEILR
jgi:thioesterase domain-containing protein